MEMEMKLLARTKNEQIKIRNKDDKQIVVNKIKTLCELLHIKILRQEEAEIEDTYWDDSKASFFEQKYTVRVRNIKSNNDDKRYYTLKAPKNLVDGALIRYEHEEIIDSSNIPFYKKNDCEFKFTEKLGIDVSFIVSDLEEILRIKNNRTSIHVITEAGNQHTICLDNYYFSDNKQPKPNYSDNFFEIEIESEKQNGSNGVDKDIMQLTNAIEQIFEYERNSESKYQRAYKWREGEALNSYVFVATDIVSYSTIPDIEQKQIIKQLNYITRKCLEKENLELGKAYYYNNTGDGYILIFEARYFDRVMSIVDAIFAKIKEYNEGSDDTKTLFVRCGLNYGTAFEYSDMKEDRNFAGDGINMVNRVMGLGSDNHIIASEDFLKHLRSRGGNIDNFTPMGPRSVKHGANVDVYNYYNEGLKIGNSELPSISS